jgi:hypothetical protein
MLNLSGWFELVVDDSQLAIGDGIHRRDA